MNRSVQFIAPLVFAAVITFGGQRPAHAGAGTDLVKSQQSALYDLLKKASPEAQNKVEATFDQMLDYGAIAEASLGSEWTARSDAEKKEFSALLKPLVRKAYERNLKKTLGYDIDYLAERPAGSAMIVTTKAKSRTNAREEPIEIAFKLVQKGGKWRVTDIVTEGVSLVTSYRAQFTKILKKDGFPSLITKMKDKLAKGDV